MSFICPICKELLLLPPNSEEAREGAVAKVDHSNDIIVTTKCGHLYHSSCLNKFFEADVGVGGEDKNTILAKSSCPSCQSVVLIKNLIQIYPSEDDNDPFGKLIAKCNSLVYQNEELKKENEKLKIENEEFQKLHEFSKPGNEDCAMASGSLFVQDRVVWFPDVSSDQNDYIPEAGIVKWIGRINEILYAGIEFENPIGNDLCDIEGKTDLFPCKAKHGKYVPVNELILYSDFYWEAAVAAPLTLPKREPRISTTEELPSLQRLGKPEIVVKKINDFEKKLNEFISFHDIASAEYKVLQDEGNRLVSEEIIAIPSAIEDQLKKSVELRSELIGKERLIENLKKLSIEILQFEDITTQEISILQEGIASLERMRDNSKQSLAHLQFHTALGHSQKIKSFTQAGYQWLNDLGSQFQILMNSYEGNLENPPKLTISELLRMKIDLEFRQPQMEHLAMAYNFFLSPGLKLKRNDQVSLKSVLDNFEELKKQTYVLNNIIIKDANRVYKILDDWCEEVTFILETEFGTQLLLKLQELATHEDRIKQEIPKLMDLKNALSKDNDIIGLDELSRNIENLKIRIETTSTELKSEIKQLKSKPTLPKAYY